MARAVVVGMALCGLGLGCGGGGSGGPGGSLDCAWLAGDNCWKMTADDAASCLPPSSEQGVLSADKKTCTYASGATVTFTPAIVLPVPQDADWNFTISSGGAECLHFENKDAAGIKLTVKGQTVTERPAGFTGLQITCPDGKSYSTNDAFGLFDCNADGGASFGGVPGNSWSGTDTRISVGLLGASQDLPLFSCALAAQ